MNASVINQKGFIKGLGIRLIMLIGPLFYDPQYLKGRHFEESTVGWRWVLGGIWFQKILGFNRSIPWPINPQMRLSDPNNIVFDPNDLNNFQTFGCYFQNFSARIYLGKGIYIAPNVGIITANHNPNNLDEHLPGQDVRLGNSCWIGMNSVILPGVHLGPRTFVGAGSVVTKSFPEGHCVIVGSPAKLVRRLESSEDALQ